MSDNDTEGTVSCEYCDFRGTGEEVIEHLVALVEVPLAKHKRMSAEELHEKHLETDTE